MIMGVCHCTALELSMMQDQKLLTVRWHWFLGGGSNMVVVPFAYKGGQYCRYGLMLLRSPVIIQDARPEICHATLTLISQMGQWECHLPFYVKNRPITPVSMDVTMQPVDCRRDQTKIVDTPLKLTSETHQQSFGVQSFCLKVITSLLTANTPFLGRIICIHKHRGLSVSEQPLFTLLVRYMT